MSKQHWIPLILAGFLASALATEQVLVQDPANHVTVTVPSGLLTLRAFDGIRPHKAMSIGGEVFTPRQMEGKRPSVTWKLESAAANKIVLSTVLQQRESGLDMKDISCRKTYEYIAAVPEIRVQYDFINGSSQWRYLYYGLRHDFNLRPNAHEATYIPASIGTYPNSEGMFLDFYSRLPSWVSTPVEAWAAQVNPALRQGLVYLLDWDTLGAFYTSKGKILGFTMDKGYLPPQGRTSLSYVIRPMKHLAGVTTANQQFSAHLSTPSKDTIRLGLHPYVSGHLEGTIELVDADRKSMMKQPVSLELTHGTPASLSFDSPLATGHTAIIFQGTMNGQSFSTEQYCENGFRMQSLPACGFAPRFQRSAPAKKSIATNQSAMPIHRRQQAICLFGLYTNFNRFDRILNGWKIDTYSVSSPSMKDIPPASTLNNYSVMILGNGFLSSLEVCLQRISSFVRQGGVLIVTGGPSAYGTGAYDKSPILRALLPVSSSPFDLQPALGPEKLNQGLAMTGPGLSVQNAPHVYWLHKDVRLSPDTQIVWRAGDAPLLVKGNYGKGRVLCFLGSPLGDPQDGHTPYWESPNYEQAMRTIILSTLKETSK